MSFAHSAGGVVLNRAGQVLVICQRDRTWSLPKGHIKEGEDPHQAARREITEESGIVELTCMRILKSYTRYTISQTGREDQTSLKRITMYLFVTGEEELHPMDPRCLEARWVEPTEVPSLLSHPKDREFFLEILPDIQAFAATALLPS